MKNEMILRQMALNTNLLGEDLKASILAGNMPPIEEIVMALLIGAMDAHAVTVGDPASSWNDKRLARMALTSVCLAAMAIVRQGER